MKGYEGQNNRDLNHAKMHLFTKSEPILCKAVFYTERRNLTPYF